MHCSKSSEGRRLCGSYARGRKRPWHVIVDFSSLSYSYNFRSRGRAMGEWQGRGVEYTRLNYEYLCNRRHVVHFGQLSSTCLASPRLRPSSTFPSLFVCPGERHRCGCPFGGQGYLCRKISTAQTYVMSFLCYTGRISTCPAWPGSSNVGGASCARVLCSVQFHLNLLKFHILF